MLEGKRAVFDQYGPVAGQFSEARASQWRRYVKEFAARHLLGGVPPGGAP